MNYMKNNFSRKDCTFRNFLLYTPYFIFSNVAGYDPIEIETSFYL